MSFFEAVLYILASTMACLLCYVLVSKALVKARLHPRDALSDFAFSLTICCSVVGGLSWLLQVLVRALQGGGL